MFEPISSCGRCPIHSVPGRIRWWHGRGWRPVTTLCWRTTTWWRWSAAICDPSCCCDSAASMSPTRIDRGCPTISSTQCNSINSTKFISKASWSQALTLLRWSYAFFFVQKTVVAWLKWCWIYSNCDSGWNWYKIRPSKSRKCLLLILKWCKSSQKNLCICLLMGAYSFYREHYYVVLGNYLLRICFSCLSLLSQTIQSTTTFQKRFDQELPIISVAGDHSESNWFKFQLNILHSISVTQSIWLH